MMGRELWNKSPNTAKTLIKPYLTAEPFDFNFTKIEDHYLVAFCSLNGIEKKQIQGPQFKSTKVDVRRIFIAAMVHIYCPHVYLQNSKEINISKKGFVMWLSKALCQHESNVSNLIREVVAWEHEKGYYDEFKERVYGTVEKLKNIA